MKRTLTLTSFLVSIALVAVGCNGGDDNNPGPTDTGVADSTSADTGKADTGSTPIDTCTTPVDTGTTPTDTGTTTDTGTKADTGTTTDTGPADAGNDTGPTMPAPPTLGAVIDRMGRPAINTATNHSFDANATTKNAAKDAYNQAAQSTWSSFVPEMEHNLAILDALDGTCGNQLLADKTKTDATRYAPLAGVLADDRLWLKSDATTCTTYLAVEANATNVIPNADCGGRMPSYDVMQETYSLVAAGAVSGVSDGISTVPDRAKVATFPYMAAPHFPPPPALGAVIDRMGRPAINTATNHSFDANATTKNAAKDAYNQADMSTWSSFVPEMEHNLAILDALDGTCGNQLLADKTKTDATRYGALAGVLADDRLWLKSDATTCTTYLAVEANFTGVITNADCGGRMPSYDVMQETYSLVAAGAVSGVSDGIATVPDRAKGTTFPYLVAPH
jgi:hypothetical protein